MANFPKHFQNVNELILLFMQINGFIIHFSDLMSNYINFYIYLCSW